MKRPIAENEDAVFAESDVWLVPSNGRVVIDERGNSVWQWPASDDPFAQQDRLQDMNAADLRVVEPSEIRRSRLPWVHESERPAKEYRAGNSIVPPARSPLRSR